MLKLYLLGPPRIELEDVAVHISRRKALALLVYLVATDRTHTRDALATLFYPDLDQSRARAYFRRDLGMLNGELTGDWLTADHEMVGLSENAEVWTDVAQFRHYLATCDDLVQANEDINPDCLPLLTAAAGVYKDHFLAGFSLSDCPEFDEWQFFEAEELRQELAEGLNGLVTGLMAQERYDQALPFGRRLLNLDPLHEPAQRQLMSLYAHAGQRAAALRQYENCVSLLDDELSLAPEEETTRLYEAIKARRLDPPAAQAEASQREVAGQIPWSSPSTQAAIQPLPPFLAEDSAADLTPAEFVVREQELSLLGAALDLARNGRGQIQFVIGGAGKGKTRLVQEFARRVQDGDAELIVVSGNCDAITGIGDPYLPFREVLLMLAGDVEARWAAGLISQHHARDLWNLMPISLPALVEYAPDLINSLVPGQALLERATTLATKDEPWFKRLTGLTTAEQGGGLDQQRIFAQYTAVIKAIAAQRPLLLIIEDLHWVDTASSGLLFHLSREMVDSQILLVGTYRPEEIVLNRPGTSLSGVGEQRHPLAGIVSELKRQHGDVWLDLGELTASEGRQFIDDYLDTQPNRLGEAFREALFRRTEGHALFTVELLRSMQERGDLQRDEDGQWFEGEAIDWQSLPVKVEGAIEKRIERLSEDLQSILTVASIEGETFTAEIVARVQELDQRTLVRHLSRELDQRHRLVKAQALKWLDPGRQRLSIYRFRHHLFQHYLYHRLDELERVYLHEAVGNIMEQLYENRTEEVAGQLALHFQEAGLLSKAIGYLQVAGNAAANVYANSEAVAYYIRAVELAEKGAVSSEELAHIYTRLGGLLLVTKGDGAPEVEQAYGRAFELIKQEDESPQHFAALRGLAMFYRLRGELERARTLSEQLVTLAYRLQDEVLIIEATFALGSLLFILGEYGSAHVYLEQAMNSYGLEQNKSLDLLYDQDLGVAAMSKTCFSLWLLGYPDQAMKRCSETLTLAQELSHPYSLAMALNWTSWIYQFCGDQNKVLEQSQITIRLSQEHDFLLFEAVGTLLRGWALFEQGDVEEGIAHMQQSLAMAAKARGTDTAFRHWLALLAEAYGKVGRPDEGLHTLADSVKMAAKNETRLLEPELYRVKGELLLIRGDPAADVEASYRQAIDISREQEAKSLELRAVMSLARLWRLQGKKEEAHRILVEIYNWFSEGFDTADLREAKALLEEL